MDSVAVGFSASARVVARKKLRVVVTGGAGFLGSHLCEHLVAQGHHVICIDNFHTGRPANVRALAASGRFEVIEHDIVRPFEHKLPRFDHIYNLACPASPAHYQADPVSTALICSQGIYNCLQAAERHGARVFHASTSEIYGDPEVHPQTEDYHGNVNTVGPRSCYDEGKRFAETLVTDFGARHGLVTRMARIFNTYGPRMQPDDGRVVSNFVVQALLGNDITVYGSGEQTRSFCFVSDLIDGFAQVDGQRGRPAWPGQSRKSGGDDGRTTCPHHHRHRRQPFEGHLQAAASRRSATPAAGYLHRPRPCSAGRRRSSSPWACAAPSRISISNSATAASIR